MNYIERELEKNRVDHENLYQTLHENRVIVLKEMNSNYCNIMEAINQNKIDITKLKTKFVILCAGVSLLAPPIANKVLDYIKN